MKIKVLFFGILAEEAGSESLEIDYEGDIFGLKQMVEINYPSFGKYSYQVSLNRVIERNNVTLKEGDEVAFLPPFAGG